MKSQKACYVYDGLRQLTKAWTPAVSAACSTAPSAAGLAGVAPFWQEYSYDTASGNRSGVVSTSKSGVVASSSYAYPAAGSARPHAVTAVTGGAGAGSYGYDASGNQTARPGQTVVFDDVGKPVTITAGAETVSNVYDASGNLLLRVSATSGATLMLGDTVLSQGKGSTVVVGHRTYVGAGGMPVAQRSAKTGTTGSTLSWLFTSTDGTVDVVTNATTGATTQSYRDPFGAPLPGTGQAWADGTGYLNKPVSASIKLTTIGARVYDAVLGKFLSVDPVIDPNVPQQNIGYAYSGNNPTTYTDPTGLRFAFQQSVGGASSGVTNRTYGPRVPVRVGGGGPKIAPIPATRNTAHEKAFAPHVTPQSPGWRAEIEELDRNCGDRAGATGPCQIDRVMGPVWATADLAITVFPLGRILKALRGAKALNGSPGHVDGDLTRALNEVDLGIQRPNVRAPKPFGNDGRGGTARLPEVDSNGRPVSYTEHTVNPRPPGGTLDGKRIVTGDDGSVWGTSDHFLTWVRMR